MPTKPISREEFFKRFSWVTDLPNPPQCSECFAVGYLRLESDGRIFFNEFHADGCSLNRGPRQHDITDKSTHQIDKRSIVDRFEDVRRAGGNSWDDIDDADEFVKQIRGEDHDITDKSTVEIPNMESWAEGCSAFLEDGDSLF